MCNLALVYPSGRQAGRQGSEPLAASGLPSVQGAEDAAVGTDRAGSSSQDPGSRQVSPGTGALPMGTWVCPRNRRAELCQALSDPGWTLGTACSSSASGCWPGSTADCGPPPLRAGKGSQGSLQAVSKCLPKRRLELRLNRELPVAAGRMDWAGGGHQLGVRRGHPAGLGSQVQTQGARARCPGLGPWLQEPGCGPSEPSETPAGKGGPRTDTAGRLRIGGGMPPAP